MSLSNLNIYKVGLRKRFSYLVVDQLFHQRKYNLPDQDRARHALRKTHISECNQSFEAAKLGVNISHNVIIKCSENFEAAKKLPQVTNLRTQSQLASHSGHLCFCKQCEDCKY